MVRAMDQFNTNKKCDNSRRRGDVDRSFSQSREIKKKKKKRDKKKRSTKIADG